MEQPYVPKLEVVRRTDAVSTPSVPRRPGMGREDAPSTPIEREIIRVFTERMTEGEAHAVMEAYFDSLLDQMHVNDQRGACDSSGKIISIKNEAEDEEHKEFMKQFTKAKLADYADAKRKFTKMAEFHLAGILEKDILNQNRGILERALERFFSRKQVS